MYKSKTKCEYVRESPFSLAQNTQTTVTWVSGICLNSSRTRVFFSSRTLFPTNTKVELWTYPVESSTEKNIYKTSVMYIAYQLDIQYVSLYSTQTDSR